jgi:site-specific recombinase XerC
LYSALKQAAADGLIPRNPAASVKAPRMDKREVTPLSPTQARALLDTARKMDDRWSALYVLSVSTDLGQGEFLALRWEAVDPESATLRGSPRPRPGGA